MSPEKIEPRVSDEPPNPGQQCTHCGRPYSVTWQTVIDARAEIAALTARLAETEKRFDFALKAAAMFGAMWEKTLPPDTERPAVCAELAAIRASLDAPEPAPSDKGKP